MAKRKRFFGIPTSTLEGRIWLTVFSDMVTNLTLFFLMLFAFTRLSSTVREDIFAALAGKKIENKQKKEEKIVNVLQKISYVDVTGERIKLTLPSPVLFDSGNANLKIQAKSILDIIAKTIKDTNYPIVIEGHTDITPIRYSKYESNFELSSARAFSVIEYFIKAHNISPERLSALGKGEYSPIYPNDTPYHKALNRRIEITIIKK